MSHYLCIPSREFNCHRAIDRQSRPGRRALFYELLKKLSERHNADDNCDDLLAMRRHKQGEASHLSASSMCILPFTWYDIIELQRGFRKIYDNFNVFCIFMYYCNVLSVRKLKF